MDGYYDDYHPQVQLRCPLVLVGIATEPARRLGHWIAATEGLPFIDLDRHIEHRAGRSLWALVAERGESYYRELEQQALVAALRATPTGVIVGGDGVALSANNRTLLANQAYWVGLTASVHTTTHLLQQSALQTTGFWHPTKREVLMDPAQIGEYYRDRALALSQSRTVIDIDQHDRRARRAMLRAALPLVA